MKKVMRIITTIIFLISIINLCYSQSISDSKLILLKISEDKIEENYHDKVKDNNSTLDYFFSGLFIFYKTLISSQDGSTCSFHPSCSEYGVMSIKKYGVMNGFLRTSDRLLRCNGFSPEKYRFIAEKNLLYDPLP